MKKINVFLLAAIMLLSFGVPPAHAAAEPSVMISSGAAKAGDTVTLTVSIQDNPGISSNVINLVARPPKHQKKMLGWAFFVKRA